jgi:hypothetical protein
VYNQTRKLKMDLFLIHLILANLISRKMILLGTQARGLALKAP